MAETLYQFRGEYLPAELRASIDAYVETGRPLGGFLEAVVDNDLMLAVGRADETNLKLIHVIVGYLHNECPSGCWGRFDSTDRWMKMHH